MSSNELSPGEQVILALLIMFGPALIIKAFILTVQAVWGG